MTAKVDLHQLVVERTVEPARPRSARSKWISRYLVPFAVLGGFVSVIGWSARDSLLPSRPVTVVPVLVARAEVQAVDTPLFQAAGWIEPRPSPSVITAMFEGVIDRLSVVDGQEVKAGEPVAYLVDAFARLALREAEANLELRRAELDSAEAALVAAKINFDEPTQRQAALAEAEGQLAKLEAELGRLPFQLRAQESRHEFARVDLESRTQAKDVIARRAVNSSKSDLDVAAATVDELKAQADALAKERNAVAKRRDILRRQLELKTDEARTLGESKAGVAAAKARLLQAELAVENAKIRLASMVVRSPTAGRVLSVVARPGSRLMGLEKGTLQEATTVLTMYDPEMLQIRADVRLEDVPRVTPGQKVRIETLAVPGGLDGRVLAPTSLADIQKNTLQVKVAIDRPPALVRPDMLVQVTFLAPPQPEGNELQSPPLRLLVPRSLVEGEKDQARTWIVDQQAGVARLRNLRIGLSTAQDLVQVLAGLAAGDRVISGGREGLKDGQRVRISGEDVNFGSNQGG